jgi:hypothetical protein
LAWWRTSREAINLALHLGDAGQLRPQLTNDLFHLFRQLKQEGGLGVSGPGRSLRFLFTLLSTQPTWTAQAAGGGFLKGHPTYSLQILMGAAS